MKIKLIVLLMMLILTSTIISEAAKIDIYREALLNKSFTIKYEIVTPPIHKTNKEAKIKQTILSGPEIFDIVNGGDNKFSGLISIDGNNKYTEFTIERQTQLSGKKTVGICKLIKDNEIFNYYWDIKDNKKRYYGKAGTLGYSKNVQAESVDLMNPYTTLFDDYDYGNPILTHALEVILPPDKIISTPNTPTYKLIGSGTLQDNLTYEDFAGSKNNTFYAIRYYFKGNDLVKIATANYTEVNSTILDYTKSVIAINEFLTKVDKSYMTLPAVLKDKTKRDNGGTKK